jgi:predicted transcriptional regulator
VSLQASKRSRYPSTTVGLGEATLQHPESTQLSRVHRRLLLLINGQRSIRELARLNVLSYKEVRSLLNDLEYAGFIKQ